MSVFYAYSLSQINYDLFKASFPDLEKRNEEYVIVSSKYYAWADPPDYEHRRKVVICPPLGKVYILVESGRADWDFIQWCNINDVKIDAPHVLYLW